MPFTADLLAGHVGERFGALVSDSLRLAYCRSVSGSAAPLRVGPLAGASSATAAHILSKEELTRSLPKKKQYSYVNRPEHAVLASTGPRSPAAAGAPAAPQAPVNAIEAAFDLSKCECLNDKRERSWKNAFVSLRAEGADSLLESDMDPQILMNLQFKVPVRLSSVAFATSEAFLAQAPSTVKLFVNQMNVGFDTAESLKPDQVISLTKQQLQSAAAVALAATKFGRVHKLSVRVLAPPPKEATLTCLP